MEKNISKLYKGLHTDMNPREQPEGTYRYALNAVNENKEGDQASLSNEGSNFISDNITPGYKPIGDKYLEDNTSVVFSVNPVTSRDEIGLLTKDGKYTVLVNTAVLGFQIGNQIDCTYRLRRGRQRVLYWVDGFNRLRTLNIDRLYNFYTVPYKNYLDAGGNPDNYFGEKWDVNSFNLIKSYTRIPEFTDVEVLDYGLVKPGSYNFAIQYVDEDLNSTEWITASNPVRIYNSSLNSAYGDIRGSYTVNEYQKFDEANKSIKLYLGNMDTSFPYFRVAIIQAIEGLGIPTKAIVSQPQDINSGIFTYSGNDDSYEAIDINEIRFDKEDILAPKHIEQLENRLIVANTKGPQYNWCEFQAAASAIRTDLVTENVLLNDIRSKGNIKNPHSTFTVRGYLPGQVYSEGIVYLMKDFTYSPVFHIPGRSSLSTSDMDLYEGETAYPNIHTCVTNYWGNDYEGNPLVGNKVRFHKFPTRRDAGYSLYNTNSLVNNFYKHTLKVKISLKPGQTYPVDGNGNPLVIQTEFNYKIIGSTATSYMGQLDINQLNIDFTIATDTNLNPTYFDFVSPGNYIELNPASQLATYTTVFDIAYYHTTELDEAITDTYNSDLFGLEFSNIAKPHPDVIGFFIVRNEVTDADKLVIDNVIVGANVKQNNYRAFTSWVSGKSQTQLDDTSVWFFSPEIIFNKRNLQFSEISLQGSYDVTEYYKPSIIINSLSEFTNNPTEKFAGVYIEDVQAGSSYDPSVHKKREKDSDGFSFHGAYKMTNIVFSDTVIADLSIPSEVFTLDAASNRIISGNVYYNVSTDNRISMAVFDTAFDKEIFSDLALTVEASPYSHVSSLVAEKRLGYATLRRGFRDGSQWVDIKSCYQDFMTRPYYKEHHNPFYFGNQVIVDNIRVFNGDAEISSATLTTSIFRQLLMVKRKTKTSVWRYIVGAILIVVGAVLSIFGGAGVGVVALGIAVLAAGAMFVHSGIKLDNLIAMFNEDYSKGLLAAIEDPFVVTAMGSPEVDGTNVAGYIPYPDDCIQWFFDMLKDVYIETRVPMGLRSGVTVGQVTDFMNSPKPYSDGVIDNYITEKVTYFDRDQGGGRLYRGVANAEVYSVNPDYSRFNKEKSYIHLPASYDCCGDNTEEYPTRVWYSQQSFQEELTDNYRSFLTNNYRDVEGENGEITDLYKIGNSLFIHTNEALWQLPQNLQERATNELTTYIGTGEFFGIPPKKILDDTLGSGGSKHKWATVKTKFGVFFVSEVENKVYLHSQGLKDISTIGMRNWFEENLKNNLGQEMFELTGVNYAHDNNPANPVGIGYLACYDTRFERILVTKKDYSLIKTVALIHTNVIDTLPVPAPYLRTDVVFNTLRGEFWKLDVYQGNITRRRGPIGRFEDFPDYFQNKSFTMSYSFHTEAWTSFHSYLPNYYIHNQSNYFSMINESDGIYKHNSHNSFQVFYGGNYPFIVEYVSINNPIINKIWEDVTFMTTAKRWDDNHQDYFDVPDVTFNEAVFYNTRQSSGEQELYYKNEGNQEDYLEEQVQDQSGIILLDRNERNWSINELRDYVIDYSEPLFSYDWDSIKAQYPIDKVPNLNVIDLNKAWDEVESFRDKFLIMRFKFNNFVDVKLTSHYFIESQTRSER